MDGASVTTGGLRCVCVFCGANTGSDPAFAAAAEAVGRALAERGMGLVYGGGNVGLMGLVADGAVARGGHVIGVIPRMLVEKELAHPGISELRIVETMHQRKALMAELADGFMALPGGFGTMDELCEILTWGQLGLHAKPIGVLNAAGYFDHLLAFMDHSVACGLLKPAHRALVIDGSGAEELLERMHRWRPVPVEKWIRKGET